MSNTSDSGEHNILGIVLTLCIAAIVLAVPVMTIPQVQEEMQQRHEGAAALADEVYGEENWEWNNEDCGLTCEREPEPLASAQTQADFDIVAPDSLSGRDGSSVWSMAATAGVLLLLGIVLYLGVGKGYFPRSYYKRGQNAD